MTLCMISFVSDNKLLSPDQSGFRLSGSWINQRFSINHEILNSFDKVIEVRGIFPDISKAFDKAWHSGLILKPRQNSIREILSTIYKTLLETENKE